MREFITSDPLADLVKLAEAGATVRAPSVGAMGIEGAVRLGYRKELADVADPAERKALFDRMVAQAYADGKALNMASFLEIDEVIDPAESRRWIASGLRFRDGADHDRSDARGSGRFIDTW